MWDTHMHCRFSGDSDADPEDMIRAAMDAGLDGICFTDHHDYDYPQVPDEESIFLIDPAQYIPYISGLREKYEGKLSVRCGIEIGMQPHVAEKNRLLQAAPFDFVIGSVHVVNGADPYYPDTYFGIMEEKEAIRLYFEENLNNIRLFPEFDSLGHLGYVVRYAPDRDEQYHPSDYADLIDEILKFLIENRKGLECNSSGLRQGLKGPIPDPQILRRYRRLGGEILTTGADAHNPADVAANFREVREILLACGFRYYAVYTERKPAFYPL